MESKEEAAAGKSDDPDNSSSSASIKTNSSLKDSEDETGSDPHIKMHLFPDPEVLTPRKLIKSSTMKMLPQLKLNLFNTEQKVKDNDSNVVDTTTKKSVNRAESTIMKIVDRCGQSTKFNPLSDKKGRFP